jgi:hypothetical protein
VGAFTDAVGVGAGGGGDRLGLGVGGFGGAAVVEHVVCGEGGVVFRLVLGVI